MNLFDKAVGVFNPEKALKMAGARERLKLFNQNQKIMNKGYGEHGASTRKKSLRGWFASLGGVKNDIYNYREKLVARSRDLYMGAPLANGALNTMKMNAVGSGLKLKSSIDSDIVNLSEDEIETLETKIEKEFNLWSNSKIDQTGLLNFYEIQDLVFLTTLLNGECFVHLNYFETQENPYSLKLSIIEPDRVNTPSNKTSDTSIVQGVQLDKNGHINGYYIQEHNPNDEIRGMNQYKYVKMYGSENQLNIIHLTTAERPGQVRGVPILAPVMESLKQLDRYTNAELTSAIISSMFTIFIESADIPQTNPGDLSNVGQKDAIANEESGTLELSSGAIVSLNKGEKATSVNPARPNAQFDPFMTAIIRQIGSSLGIPYELMIMHFTSSYSASRAALLEAWKTFRKKREWFAKNFCQLIYEEWLREAVLLGRIEIKDFENDILIRKAYSNAIWSGTSQGQLDPIKEVNAAILRINAGLSTRSRETIELNGGDFEQNIKILAKEQKIANEKGVILDGTIYTEPPNDEPGE